jgi:hypothetical protein
MDKELIKLLQSDDLLKRLEGHLQWARMEKFRRLRDDLVITISKLNAYAENDKPDHNREDEV